MTYLTLQILTCLLLAFLLGALLGWWVRRQSSRADVARAEKTGRRGLDACQDELESMRADLASCRMELDAAREKAAAEVPSGLAEGGRRAEQADSEPETATAVAVAVPTWTRRAGGRPRLAPRGIGLALSGGGYRAGLFHVGALQRLNELGWLRRLDEVTSVSGGSITAGYLALRWDDLRFDDRGVARNLRQVFVGPLRDLFATTIDVNAVLGGAFNPVGTVSGRSGAKSLVDAVGDGIARFAPGSLVRGMTSPLGVLVDASVDTAGWAWDRLNPFPSPSTNLIRAYDSLLFHGATLQDLPEPGVEGNPRFTFYATNMQSGVSVRLARDYMADYRLGRVMSPELRLAEAVAASSAFPPFFAPVEIRLDSAGWQSFEGADLAHRADLRKRMDLADGGAYDNMGVERLLHRCETVLVSDGGLPLEVEDKLPFDWVRQTLRTTDIIMSQVNKLRKRMLIEDFQQDERQGTYWGISSDIGSYGLEKAGLPGPLIRDSKKTRALARMRTRLTRFSAAEQERLINWGYALADAGMRRWVLSKHDQPRGELPCS